MRACSPRPRAGGELPGAAGVATRRRRRCCLCARVGAAGDARPSPACPASTDPKNLYGAAGAGKLSDAVKDALPRVYVPNLQSNDVYVIDPATFTVVDKFRVGLNPQHVVPAWDLKTLWVANNAENTTKGSLTPIDPKTGKPGKAIAVDDPYNMYFTPDGKEAIVVAEAYKRLDFRDPQTMALEVVAGDAAVRRHQPRRLLDRRPLRDLHLRVRRHAGEDRHGRVARCSAT